MNPPNINENKKSSASQTDRILDYMLSGKSITPLEALEKFGSFRLGARIADIRAKGYLVYSEFITLPNGKRVKRYNL